MTSRAHDILTLIEKKKEIESNISATEIILKMSNIGMRESLTDAEDYPRQDLPIYEVRQARSQLIHLLNDYKTIVDEIENALVKYHSQNLPEFQDKSSRPPHLSTKTIKHLAKINSLEKGSPAEYAGLKEEDIILEFDSVNGDNFTSLHDIRNAVEKSVNVYIKVIVEREGKLVRVNLRPKNWEGLGLLGCNILPL